MEKKPGSKLVAVLVIVISIVAILVIYHLTVGAKAAQYEETSRASTAPPAPAPSPGADPSATDTPTGRDTPATQAPR